MIQQQKNNVESQYDAIAAHFAQTRRKHIAPELQKLVSKIKPGSRILDVGCGSGRLLRILPKNIEYVGIDCSQALLEEAKNEFPGQIFIKGDIRHFHDYASMARFDAIICIAVLHHISPIHLNQVLLNCANLLKPGAMAIFSLWNLWNKRFLKLHTEQIYSKIEKMNISAIDVPYSFLDDQNKKQTISRECYAYSKINIYHKILKANFRVEQIFYDDKMASSLEARNLYILASKNLSTTYE